MKYKSTLFTLLLWFTSSSVNAQPLEFSAEAGDQRVTLSWNDYDSPDVIGYIVKRNYYNTDAPNSYYQLNTELITGNSYHEDGLTNCVRYSYSVYPVFNDGLRINSSVVNATPYKDGEIYYFKGDTYLSYYLKKGSTYVIEEDFNLKGSARLYIDAGVVVKFKDGAKLTSEIPYNMFLSMRMYNKPIIFTSYKDDEHGGDTNGDGDLTQPQAGDWNTIQVPLYIYNGMPYCKVLYATTGYTFPEVGDNEISFWSFENCINAIGFENTTTENTQFSENDIINCTNFINGEPGTNFSAANNWFGDASGPNNASLNPEGKGCTISDNIPFEPYSKLPYLNPDIQNEITDKEFKEDEGQIMNIDLNTIFTRSINFDYQLGYSVEIEGEAISAKIENNSLIIETLENRNGNNTVLLRANTTYSYYSTTYDKGYFTDLAFNLNLTPVNDAPTAIQLSNTSIVENSAIGSEVGTLSASDVDAAQTFTYTIAENDNFEIVGDKLLSKVVFDYETQDSYTVEITVSDQGGLSHTQSFSLQIEDFNEAPSAIQLSSSIIAENSAIGTELGILTASDEDASQTFTYTIAENDNFEIVGDKLESKSAFDFEILDNYSVEVTVADQDGLSHKQSFAIQIADANEAPSAIQLSVNTIIENAAIGTEVGVLTASDVDANQTFTYTIAENESFEIEGDKLVSKSNFDFESQDSYTVEITVADQDGLSFKDSFSIQITDLNEAPTAISLSNATITENSTIGTEVGLLTASDVDIEQTFTYTIAENENFEINGDKLLSKGIFDYEALDSYSVEITVADQGGLIHKQSFAIEISDVKEAPTAIQLSNTIITENSAIGTEVGTLTASDEDAGQIFTYTIAENANFEIAGDKLVSKVAFDFETLDNYTVELTVTDQGGLSHTQSFTIQVTDANEAPSAIQLSNSAITENSAIGTEVGTLTASDVDASQTFIYTMAENANFEIAGDKLVSKAAFDFETQDSYSVEVTVTDQGGLSHTQSFTIQVTDVNEAPSATQLSNATIAENSAIGTEVGILTASDEDANQIFTYTIADNENFEIVDDKLVSKAVFDFETNESYTIEVTVRDQGNLSFKEIFTVQVIDENEAPTEIQLSNTTIVENSVIGSEVGTLTASDEDANQTFTYTISDNENFDIVDDKLVSKAVFDFETLDSYSVAVTVRDQGNLSYKEIFTVQFIDENEAPTAIQLSANAIVENAEIGAEVGVLTASDGDANQNFTYTIAENENFEIAGDKLISKADFDFETQDSYTVEIAVKDQGDLSHTQNFVIQISDVNEAPSAIQLSNLTIAENSAIGAEVGSLTTSDEDANQTFTYTIAEKENFEIVGDQLLTKVAFDYEVQDSYSVELTVSDQDGLSHTQSLSIQIEDVNEVPSVIQLSNTSIIENAAIGTEVGTLSASDEDANQTLTFAIAENEFFELVGNKLVSKTTFNFEIKYSYSAEISVIDQDGLSFINDFSIQIENVNEAPVFISEAITEGVEAVKYVYTVECMDVDEDAISLVAIEKPDWLSLLDNGDGTCTLSGTPAQGGLYHVILEVKDSEFTTQQEFDIDVEVVTGIEPDLTARTVNIYPNPAVNELHIDLSNFKGEELSIALYSLTGKLIFNETHQSIGEEVSIHKSLQHLKSGMYLLMIENDGSRKTYKIVKK